MPVLTPFPSARNRRWFGLSVVCSIWVLLVPGSWVLAAKLWLVSWLPFAGQLENASSAGHADKVVHALLFATMGALAVRCWLHNRRQLGWVLWGVLCLAPLSEWLQAWVPGRGSSWADGVADIIGLALGVGLAWRTGGSSALQPISVKAAHA